MTGTFFAAAFVEALETTERAPPPPVFAAEPLANIEEDRTRVQGDKKKVWGQ